MDAISKFLESRSDARNTYTSEDNLHMTRDGFMIPPVPQTEFPILGGNIYQGFDPDVEMSVPVQEVPGKNDPSRRLLELMSPAAELLSKDFGAAFQQYRIAELEKYIDDGTLEPIDYQLAVIENPTVPLGDYYDAAANAFFGVPSDDYILHLGQLYPRRFTDQSSGEEVDLSEDSMLMNLGRYVMSAFMTDPLGVGTSAIAPAARLVRSAMGDTPDSNVLASGIVPSGVPSTEAADVSDIGFYSAVNRAVEALPMEKGSASQMRSMIAKAEGVKPEEMAWIGLDDFLKGKKSVTKAEVQDYVQANQVQLEEVTKRGDLPQRTADEWQDLIDNAEAQGDYDAADALTQQWEAAEGLGGTAYPNSPKFASYTLPGGENYREVLLTLPVKYEITELPPNYVVEKITEGMGNRPMYGVKEPGSQYIGFKDSREAAVADALRVINEVQNKTRNTDAFRGAHFEEPNVIAHMRLNDRTGPEGERILFIEEIQSDWHQKGRKAGYKTPEDTAAIAQINGRLDKLLDREMEINGDLFDNYGLGGTALPDGNGVRFYSRDIIENNDYKNIGRVYANGSFYVDEAFGAANPAIADRIKELSEISAERAQLKQQRSEITRPSRELARVPDAPMKKTWHEMSFRRVARMAAEEGYDAIAWTPGKMQAERYDLSKQVDEIRAIRNEDGSFNVYAVQERSYGIEDVIFDRDNLDIAGVEEIVGKDLAEKIQGQNEVEVAYTGIDLQVGGEGMTGFYDKMLKNYAAKWGKKFGAKVGVTDIKSREYTQGEPVETGVPINEMNDQQLLGELGYSNIKDVETKVWTLPVTKKMRDSIMQKGVPLFAAGGAAVMSQVEGERNGN